MAVAKSFQNFPIVSEIFKKNGREYVKVQNPKTKTIRTVRWYPKLCKIENNELIHGDNSESWASALGFQDEDYVYIFRDLDYSLLEYEECDLNKSYKDFLSNSSARHNTIIGWYLLPKDKKEAENAGMALKRLYVYDIFCYNSRDILLDKGVRSNKIHNRLYAN